MLARMKLPASEPRRPVVLVHGYSSGPGAFDAWRQVLVGHGYDPRSLLACHYDSLVHRVNIQDIGEAFEDAIAVHPELRGDRTFDAIVHSTGMLVIRCWTALDPDRNRARLKHLVALAPATFGSPLAHKGRGYLARMVVGNKDVGPDFLAVGDEVLDGLELGSRFTWDLAHRDLVGNRAQRPEGAPHPHTFVLCGIDGYRGLRGIVNEPGTDGTVRLAATALNSRKIELDMTKVDATHFDADPSDVAEADVAQADAAQPDVTEPGDAQPRTERPLERTVTAPWSTPDVPMIALADQNHGTIMSDPSEQAAELVLSALDVHDEHAYDAWRTDAVKRSNAVIEKARRRTRSRLRRWQQLVFHVRDERGDGVEDYFIDFVHRDRRQRRWRVLEGVDMQVHPYRRDPSYRCFHVDLDSFAVEPDTALGVRLIASTGTRRIRYEGYSSASITMLSDIETAEESEAWTAALDLDLMDGVELFHPFTTTLVEVTIDRRTVAGQVLRFAGVEPG